MPRYQRWNYFTVSSVCQILGNDYKPGHPLWLTDIFSVVKIWLVSLHDCRVFFIHVVIVIEHSYPVGILQICWHRVLWNHLWFCSLIGPQTYLTWCLGLCKLPACCNLCLLSACHSFAFLTSLQPCFHALPAPTDLLHILTLEAEMMIICLIMRIMFLFISALPASISWVVSSWSCLCNSFAMASCCCQAASAQAAVRCKPIDAEMTDADFRT